MKYSVHVSKDYMKFNAAHFIAYKGFREKLHGHNYRLSVTISGNQIGHDGYVVDFAEIKNISKMICKDLNETFLVPLHSDVLKIHVDDKSVTILAEDGAKFLFPLSDCSLLPIIHSSAEELSIYITEKIIQAFTLETLKKRGATSIKVGIAEASNQLATLERDL